MSSKTVDILSVTADGKRFLVGNTLGRTLFVYNHDREATLYTHNISIPGELRDAVWTRQGNILCTISEKPKNVVWSLNSVYKVMLMNLSGDVILHSTQLTIPWCVSVATNGVIYVADRKEGIFMSADGGLTTSWFRVINQSECDEIIHVTSPESEHGQLWLRAYLLSPNETSWSSKAWKLHAYDLGTINSNGLISSWHDVKLMTPKGQLPISAYSRMTYAGNGHVIIANWLTESVVYVFSVNGYGFERQLFEANGINFLQKLTMDTSRQLLYIGAMGMVEIIPVKLWQ